MKKLYYLIVLALILGLVLTGCSLLSNVGQVPTTEQSGISYLTKGAPGDPPDVLTLYASQNIDVGTVSVWNDGINLTVTYNTTDGWVMTETHLAVVADPEDFLTTKKGNPKVGHFPYQCYYDEDAFPALWKFHITEDGNELAVCTAEDKEDATLTEITYIIPFGSDPLYIAAHASLLKLVDTVEVYAIESTPTDSNVPLESGKNYLLKASGTASANPDTPIVFDAEYSSTGLAAPWLDAVPGLNANVLDLSVDGEFIYWGAYNSDHIYYWDMTGKDSCVALLIDDTNYPNNSGFLTVDIYLYPEETAWAEGERFTPKGNWATYLCYCAGGLDLEASKATFVDNEDRTGTMYLTVLDLCGEGIEGLELADIVLQGVPYQPDLATLSAGGYWDIDLIDNDNGEYEITFDRTGSVPYTRLWGVIVMGEVIKDGLSVEITEE